MSQTAEMEKYLEQTGYLGKYGDNAFSCFCDEPKGDRAINNINLNNAPSNTGNLVKKPVILTKSDTNVFIPDTPIKKLEETKIPLIPFGDPMQGRISDIQTEIKRTPSVDVTSEPNNVEIIEPKKSLFGGNWWVWLLLAGGAVALLKGEEVIKTIEA